MSSPDGNSRSDFIPEPSAASLTYGRSGGCFVSRARGALIAAAVIAAIILAAAFGRYVWAPAPEQSAVAGLEAPGLRGAGSVQDGAGQRLPQDVLPIRYRLHLWPVLDAPAPGREPFSFEGRLALTVSVANEAGADLISLHAASSLNVDAEAALVLEADTDAERLASLWDTFPARADQSDLPDGAIGVTARRSAAWDQLQLQTAEQLRPGAQYIVFLRFNGTMTDSLSGLYRSSYVDIETKAKKWLAVTHMQPTYAREAFPCMDEPGFRAPFHVSIASSNATHAIANAPLNSTEPIAEAPGWTWYHFEESVPMATYLFAFAVTDFESISPLKQRARRYTAATGNNEVEVRLWARPGVLRKGRYAVEMAPKILHYFGEYFSVKYPLRKLDLLAIPDFDAGAMENWGLVIFREVHLLVDPETDGVYDVELVASTVAHELAHQWLGNLVTAAWWDELWLNEGFSEYLQNGALDYVEPSWRMSERFQVSVLQSALSIDSSKTSRAIASRLSSKHDIAQAFDSIAYDKGACLLRMLHHSLGDAAFRRGVRQYMQKWKHNSTTESRLWEPLTEAALAEPPSPASGHVALPDNTTVAQVMAAWTRTTGYPVVNVTRDRAAGTLVLTQEAFVDRVWERNESRPYSGPQLWHVPISMVTESEAAADASRLQDTRPRAWLVERTLVLDLPRPDDWVLVNLLQTGYYRVNYDLDNWRQLTAQLRRDHLRLPAGVRAQLLVDAFDLAFAGQLPYEVALNLTAYLPRRERDPRVWQAALSSIGAIGSQLAGQPDLVLYERYMQQLLEPLWEGVAPSDPTTSATPSPTEANATHEELLHRADIISMACRMHVDKCEDWARRAVHLWRLQEDPDTTNTIPKLLQSTAYCTAVHSGSSDVWDFMWARYTAAGQRDVDQQSTILGALACTSDPARAAYLLERSLHDADIRQQDAGTVWAAAATEPVASLVVFPYFRDHWSRIIAKFGVNTLISNSVVVAATMSRQSLRLSDLEAFRAAHNESLAASSRSLDSCAEALQITAEWREKSLPAVVRWLEAALRNPATFIR